MVEDWFLWFLGFLCVLFVAAILFLPYKLAEVGCASKAEMMQTEYEYGVLKGCWVQTDSGFVDYQRLIYTKVR